MCDTLYRPIMTIMCTAHCALDMHCNYFNYIHETRINMNNLKTMVTKKNSFGVKAIRFISLRMVQK